MLAIDTETGEVLHTQDIDQRLKTAKPYKRWLRENALRVESTLNQAPDFRLMDTDELLVHQKMFWCPTRSVTRFCARWRKMPKRLSAPWGRHAHGRVIQQGAPCCRLFSPKFAQVTNPAIDPLREAIVMSLETCLGAERNVFEETAEHANRIILTTPVLSPAKFLRIANNERPGFTVAQISMGYLPEEGLEQAIRRVCDEAEQAVRSGKVLLILSDKDLKQGELPVNALMATGAVHHHLSEKRLRCNSNIIVETGWARDPHHLRCCLASVPLRSTRIWPIRC